MLAGLACMCLAVACQNKNDDGEGGAGAGFFLGHWSRSDSFGDNQTTMTSWTFRSDNTLIRDGYPVVFAEARYKLQSLDPAKAVLTISDRRGPQADWLPDSLTVTLVSAGESTAISVDGSEPLMKSRNAP